MKPFIYLFLLLISPFTLFAQHDNGRNAVRDMAKGQFERAVERAIKKSHRSNSPNTEVEQQFVLALIASAQGDSDKSFEHTKKALEMGLPLERFIVGPRKEFQALYKHAEFQKLKESFKTPLIHGPLIGSVTDTSAKVWIRTKEESEFTVKLSGGGQTLEVKGSTKEADDFTGIAEVEGLQASTEYFYELVIGGESLKKATFKTNSETGKSAKFSIAFGGGAGYNPQFEHVWDKIGALKPQALLLLGDNVYIDDPTMEVTNKYCYYRRQSRHEWKKLTASVPVFSIYDDHDFGMDDCEPGPAIDSPPWKKDVLKIFKQNWANPSYGGGEANPGCWYDFKIADVHFIMMDCRYYRHRKSKSMLGPVQKKWFLETLKKSDSTFKILVSSVPWTPNVKPGSRDTWDGYSEEREEIFSLIKDEKIEGVVLMSADRHRSDLRKIPRKESYGLYEMMSSRLSNTHVHGLVENAKGSEFIFGYNKTCSFGVIDFDTTAKPASLTYKVFSIDGKEQNKYTITLDKLKH